MDAALFSGLLGHLADTLAFDYAYIDQYTSGLTEALARAREIAPDVAATAAAAGLDAGDVQRFFNMFRATPRSIPQKYVNAPRMNLRSGYKVPAPVGTE
jgi:assimilatory nitrate reductase catalytic subunit